MDGAGRSRLTIVFPCILFVLAAGCGENIESNAVVTFQPPHGLMAYSVNDSTIHLQWSSSPDSVEPTFLGYIIQTGAFQDSLPPTTLSYVASSLPPGVTIFTLFSYRSDGPISNPVTIQWAPATRFDSAVTVFEYDLQNPARVSALNAGSETTDPEALDLDQLSIEEGKLFDLYVYGGSGQISTPLQLWSASRFRVDLNPTRFSTIHDASSTLDFPRSSFPAVTTFTLDSVFISDNTIYYARLIGDSSDTLYARIQVRIVPGQTFPNRSVEFRVSLQRVPGILFAWSDFSTPFETEYNPLRHCLLRRDIV